MKHKNLKNEVALKDGEQKKIKIHLLLILGLSFLLYAQTIPFGLTNFDDDLILGNIQNGINEPDVYTKAFTTDAFFEKSSRPFYRPVQTLSYIFNLKMSNENSTKTIHLTNILIFVLITCFLYLLFQRFNFTKELSLFATLIFATHPLFVSSVSWIPSRGDLFLTLFSIMSMINFVDFIKQNNKKALILTWLWFTLALFSKETAAFLPLLFTLYYFIFRESSKIKKEQIFLAVLIILSGLIWYYLRSSSVYFGTNIPDISTKAKDILSNFLIIPTSISLLFVPYEFATIPAFSLVKILLGSLILGAMLFLIIKNSKRPLKEKIFFLIWFLLLLIPTFAIKHLHFDYLDHRFMLPSIGVFLLILSLIPENWIKTAKSKWLLTFIIIIFFGTSFVKSKAYANPLSFFTATINHNGAKELAFHLRGVYEQNSGNYSDAIRDYDSIISINKTAYLAYNNRGTVKSFLNDYSGAAQDYSKCISINKSFPPAYKNRGIANYFLGRYKDAILDFNKYLRLEKNDFGPYLNRGILYHMQGDCKKAIEDYDIYLSKIANNPDCFNEKGIALQDLKKYEEALNCFSNAISINPNYTQAYYNRAHIKFILKDFPGTIEDCNKVLETYPTDSNIIQLKDMAQKNIGKP
jgi:tetratricopeptide (TPR) repeat protein